MLSFPDQQRKFEQLRAHWEAADTGRSTKMVGRRAKPTPQEGVGGDLQHNAGSKFRRKLSNGFALISLTQRRQSSSNASLAVSAPSTNDSSTAFLDPDAFTSLHTDSTSVNTFSDPPLPLKGNARASEDRQTPRTLPRSRTFSYIPRLIKLDTEASPIAEREESNNTSLETVMTDLKPHPPSRIPTPSPPQSKRRVSSPRQYIPPNPPLQASLAKKRQSFTGVTNGSPAKAARSKEAASIKSVSTSVSATVTEVPEDTDEAALIGQTQVQYRFQDEDAGRSIELNKFQLGSQSMSFSDPTALPPTKAELDLKSISRPDKATEELSSHRRWSISQRFYPDSADDTTCVQVKDYMPPLYWAGRFQSRFDQWRTEAMVAVRHPYVKSEDDGPLGQCGLDEEKKAIVLIFMQLRDLCASAQAADSLHEFEYKYRKDHKLLDTKINLPPSLRKPDNSTAKGPIGRAVRRLTPRKASFANLFKGKGWNRVDDAKTVDVSGHIRELQDIASFSDGRGDEDENNCESVPMHAR
ncbi:uncharacterized protein M421DRAFT_1348 [Didymella exigua CBS 183.55]|uniref:Uncharacterized protein n=1 Tax=Didymella exigua CBS 183.55 TaxID=1150837 RepID=A0A6A5S2Q7_9PLEO|nr:uncharacterized protein M421DRAFT_1348 [Didymella exigua CBS 183.55]KAF1932756.1 hypothetical protein M421DRAFT_1348 [Didymella exigua CBS 183.55]